MIHLIKIVILFAILSTAWATESTNASVDTTFRSTVFAAVPVEPGSKGDVTGNGLITIADVLIARDIYLQRIKNPDSLQFFAADLNSDGFISKEEVANINGILLLKAMPPPTLFSLDVSQARIGDRVVLKGAAFDLLPENNVVTINQLTAKVLLASPTRLEVIVPTGAATGKVQVGVKSQTSNALILNVIRDSTAPVLELAMPPVALRGEEIVLKGSKFGVQQSTSSVTFGDVDAEKADVLLWSDSQINVKVPVTAFPGPVTVTVAGKTSNGLAFEVTVIEVQKTDPSEIATSAEGIKYVVNEILLDFFDSVSLNEISQFLSRNNLRQVGMLYRPRLIQAKIDDGRDPFDLADNLQEPQILESANVNIFSELKDIASESFPQTLKNAYKNETAIFSGFLPANNYHHFAMRTFAGHRLAERVMGSIRADVRLAILDSGLGDGSTADPAEFKSRIRNPVDVGLIDRTTVKAASIIEIKDETGHGTAVTGMAAGAGEVCLGTGKHVNILPIKGDCSAYHTAASLEIAAADYFTRVINISSGSIEVGASEYVNNKRMVRQIKTYQKSVDHAIKKGKIIVIAAGNESQYASLSTPQSMAPDEPRKYDDPTLMVVSGTTLSSVATFPGGDIGYLDALTNFTNKGLKISVAAPAEFHNVLLYQDYTGTSGDGTSYAAPLVAGLAAEMILVDEVLFQTGRRASTSAAQKIVQIIEKTADDLGQAGWDRDYGHGRISVWKALLATVNGGLNSEITSPAWYGLEIRAPLQTDDKNLQPILLEYFKSAKICIDGVQLSDGDNQDTPFQEIRTFKRIPPAKHADGSAFMPIANSSHPRSDYMATFSITSNELGTGQRPFKRLQIKQADAPSSPIFALALDVARMRSNLWDMGLLQYDDFVFTVTIPRISEINSPRDGQKRWLTETVNGKAIRYPIGAEGDALTIKPEYPNSGYFPYLDSLILQFNSRNGAIFVKPKSIENNEIRSSVQKDALTGPVILHHMTPQGDTLFSVATLTDFITPRVVNLTTSSMNSGSTVYISIQVPHFNATLENTKIEFSGTAAKPPDKITSATNDPFITHILETRVPDQFQSGPVKIIITVDDDQKVEFSGGEVAKFNYCEIRLKSKVLKNYSNKPANEVITYFWWEAPVSYVGGAYRGSRCRSELEQAIESVVVFLDPQGNSVNKFFASLNRDFSKVGWEGINNERIEGSKDIPLNYTIGSQYFYIIHGPSVGAYLSDFYYFYGSSSDWEKITTVIGDPENDLQIKLYIKVPIP